MPIIHKIRIDFMLINKLVTLVMQNGINSSIGWNYFMLSNQKKIRVKSNNQINHCLKLFSEYRRPKNKHFSKNLVKKIVKKIITH
ncbi:UNVERIFIED_CONTAM: hypothetical protein NCL1_06795 [Trichonephila clavipes]